MTRASLALIRLYQMVLAPLFRGMCRYEPTCSNYGFTALERFGFRRGWWLALRRLGRCRPFGGHGWDPVPEEYLSRRERRRQRRAAAGQGDAA